MAYLPLGTLVSFGSSATPAVAGDRLLFSGTGAVSPSGLTTPLYPKLATTPLLDPPQPGGVYPRDRGGMSNLPFRDPGLTCKYLLYSTQGADSAAWSDIQAQFNQLYTWFTGSYAYNGTAGVGGQTGDLIVQDASGTVRTCPARWTDCTPPDWAPGEVGFALVTLSFVQLSAFS